MDWDIKIKKKDLSAFTRNFLRGIIAKPEERKKIRDKLKKAITNSEKNNLDFYIKRVFPLPYSLRAIFAAKLLQSQKDIKELKRFLKDRRQVKDE